MKKRIAFFLCFLMLLTAFPVFAAEDGTQETVPEETVAATESEALIALRALLPKGKPKTEAQRIRKQIIQTHITSLEETGHETLGGRCGLQVSWELYLLGINKHLQTMDGNRHYDYYSALHTTTGGYTVRAFSAETHDLRAALNAVTANGTQDVYNLMACFEKTNTEAGQIYGHVCYIHAILDGMVYCTEGFATRWGTIEGEPVVITIDQFVSWWTDWTEYEGLVYFGTKDPLESYTYTPCDLYIQAQEEQQILTSPDTRFGALIRVAAMGERIHATGLYEDAQQQRFYRVDDDGQTGFVLADKWSEAVYTHISVMRIAEQMEDGWNLKNDNWYYYENGVPLTGWLRVDGMEYYLDEQGMALTGWQTINGSPRYFSQTGGMRIGWLNTEDGMGYRMRNGAAATGWRMIDGDRYCFDEKGMILCGGWTELENGWYYFNPDGKTMTGWVELDGVNYSFHADGYLLAKRQIQDGKDVMLPYDNTWTPVEKTNKTPEEE